MGVDRTAVLDARLCCLGGLIDYAGPFPPALLPIPDAAANYEREREGPDGWLMARFACPVDGIPALAGSLRAAELVPVTAIFAPPSGEAEWVSEVIAQAERLSRDAALATDRIRVELAEIRLPPMGVSEADLRVLSTRVADLLPSVREVFLELTAAPAAFEAALDGLAQAGGPTPLGAKLRFGGPTPEAVPSPAAAATFLTGCARRGLRAKATAGLHHPRCDVDGAPGAPEHGFLNLIAAAALAHHDAPAADVEDALADPEPDALTLSSGSLRWREHRFSPGSLARMREQLLVGFGSCSIREPAEALWRIGVLER